MSRILKIKRKGAGSALHSETLLRKWDQERKVWIMLEKPWLSGLTNKCRKLKTLSGKWYKVRLEGDPEAKMKTQYSAQEQEWTGTRDLAWVHRI